MLYPISPDSKVMMSTDIYHSKFEFQIIEILCDFSRIFFPPPPPEFPFPPLIGGGTKGGFVVPPLLIPPKKFNEKCVFKRCVF